MKVLITRPLEDALPLKDALAAEGHESLIEPLLGIVQKDPAAAPIDLSHIQALLFTSANGVRVFATRQPERSLPAFAVGAATAEAARAAGFKEVFSADGDVAALTDLVRRALSPDAGGLFQPAASTLAGDLKADLEAAGFTLRRQVIYDAVPLAQFSPPLIAALKQGQIGAVTLFSPRTAGTFEHLIQQHGLASCLETCLALCLSRAVEAKIRLLPWRETRVAAAPDQKSLLACLNGTRQAGKKNE